MIKMKRISILLIITMLAFAGKAQVAINTDGSAPASGSILHVKGSGGHAFFIDDSSGKVGIGTLTPSEMLEVDGNTKITGNVNVGTKVNRPTQGTADLIPIAYGIVKNDGTVLEAGTGNWSVVKYAKGKYNITIDNETYNSNTFITMVTPRFLNPDETSDDVRIANFGRVDGTKLRVNIKDGDGDFINNTFHFIIYKP